MLKALQRLYSNIITEITVVQRLSMSPSGPWQPNRCTLIFTACPWSFGCMTNRREISTGLMFTFRLLADSHRVHCNAQQQSSAETAVPKWKTRVRVKHQVPGFLSCLWGWALPPYRWILCQRLLFAVSSCSSLQKVYEHTLKKNLLLNLLNFIRQGVARNNCI